VELNSRRGLGQARRESFPQRIDTRIHTITAEQPNHERHASPLVQHPSWTLESRRELSCRLSY